tara:strand:- start:1941 stop:3098 length:1158 start_codon:yes stop_codon:yes gene_type:complete
MIYEPAEDSYLLQKQIKKYCKPSSVVLDIGTGSGIQAREAALYCNNVIGVDIQQSVIDNLNEHKKYFKNKRLKRIKYKVSDLFSNVKGKFDLILFNPPYLPQDIGIDDITIYGGKKGYELIERFLSEVNNYLKVGGKVLLLFSSLSKEKKVIEFIEKSGLKHKIISKQKVFFEELFVVLLEKNDLVKTLEKKNVKNIKLFAHGRRGLIYTGDLGKKKISIKTKHPQSKAVGRIKNEIKFLKIFNKKRIGPKILFFGKGYFAYKFVEGIFIKEFLEKSSKAKIKKVLKNVFEQCFVMDKLGVNKEEMHNPYKHVIVGKKIVLIDFERSNFSPKVHNVTQFLQYLLRNQKLLNKKGFKVDRDKLIELGQEYKGDLNKVNFNRILKIL